MKTIQYFITIIVISQLISACNDKQNVEHLIFKGEICFKPESDKPYTGKVFELQNNGNLQFEGFYKDGKKNGEFNYFDDVAGKRIIRVENYKDGQRHGKFINYNTDGTISRSGIYNMGKKNGIFTYYNKFGKTVFEGEFENDFPKNIHRYWYDDGSEKLAEYNHSNGSIEIPSAKLFYPNGKIKTEFKRTDKNTYQMLEYFASGKLSHQLRFSFKDYEERENNSLFHFHYVGGIETESRFDIGNGFNQKFDVETFYFEDGKISEKVQYFYPNLGTIQRTYRNGKIVVYNDVTSYTERFNSMGLVTYKNANSRSGGYGPVEGDELKNMVLLYNGVKKTPE